MLAKWPEPKYSGFEVKHMNMYKFGNYICRLREEKNLTQAELAARLDVSDKTVSKWENGQAFPRIETLEALAMALETTVEDIYCASKDGVNRICIENACYAVTQLEVNGLLSSIRAEESQWIEVAGEEVTLKISGEWFVDEEDISYLSTASEKRQKKRERKAEKKMQALILRADCTYQLSHIPNEARITVQSDMFDVGDKTATWYDFQICYPKPVCDETVQVELLEAKPQNKKEIIQKYKKLGLVSDLGMNFLVMFLSYHIRGWYFKHLCKPGVLKENILNARQYQQEAEEREENSKPGRGCLLLLAAIAGYIILVFLVFPVLFVGSQKPYLVAEDYSTITHRRDVYVRIDELPSYAHETRTWLFDASIWMDCRKEGLSRWEQAWKEDKVQLFEDDEGRKYLWLVEDYGNTAWDENGEHKEYEDFTEHYVYVCENP